jgi:hypothetical protein
MKRSALPLSLFCLFAMPAFSQESPVLQHDRDVQRAQHAVTEGSIARQKDQADMVRDDTRSLQEQRAMCRSMPPGPGRRACLERVNLDKAQKQRDITAFRADKAVHQRNAAMLEADHAQTVADAKALKHKKQQ